MNKKWYRWSGKRYSLAFLDEGLSALDKTGERYSVEIESKYRYLIEDKASIAKASGIDWRER
jgi:hypothetical protein